MAMIKKDIGAYSAYAIAVKHGYKGTEEEWTASQEQARVDSQTAAKAAQAAQEAAETARKQAQTAKTGAETAQGAAGQAAQAAQTAKEAAAKAAQAAQEAQTGAEAAQWKAEEAAQGVAADREQIGANKSGLAETKAILATTQEALKKAQRAIQLQAELNKGQTWDFEGDTQEAYQRQVPSGAKAGAVMAVGGKTVVWNQPLGPNEKMYGLTKDGDQYVATARYGFVSLGYSGASLTVGHKYCIGIDIRVTATNTYYRLDSGRSGYSTPLNTLIRNTPVNAWTRYRNIAAFTPPSPELAQLEKLYVMDMLESGWTPFELRNAVCCDLTLLFGPGNEPADTSDPRIAQIEAYAAAHPEYNAGELVSALVDEVRVVGRNLVSAVVPNKTSRGVNLKSNGDGTYIINGTATGGMANFESEKFMLTKGKKYKLVGAPPDASLTKFYSYLRNHGGYTKYLSEVSGRTFIAEFDEYIAGFDVKAGNTVNNVIWKPMVVENSDATYADYSPWHKETYPIPSAVKALPGYGWSAGSVGNTIERTENGWQYVQRVGSRAYQEGDELTDGTTTYYALATPITTDITALMGDSLAPFAVEAGGSITLHHPKADEGFAIDVPAKIQYITKLSEVSANG
jgi:hypothetical protein